MKRLWSDEEIDLLKDKFAIGDLEKLAKQMHRTVRAVVCPSRHIGRAKWLSSHSYSCWREHSKPLCNHYGQGILRLYTISQKSHRWFVCSRFHCSTVSESYSIRQSKPSKERGS